MDSLSVRAMDTDTLSQVKEKILEAFCKNVPYSQWPRVEDVDLGKEQMHWTGQSLRPEEAADVARLLSVSVRERRVRQRWRESRNRGSLVLRVVCRGWDQILVGGREPGNRKDALGEPELSKGMLGLAPFKAHSFNPKTGTL